MSNNEDFLYIEDCKNDIDRIIKDITNKCENLSSIYKEYIKEAAKKEEFLSSLDKMLFQIEITSDDVRNYINLYNTFLYKIYGQYYKFYMKIINILQNIDSFDFLKQIEVKKFRPFIDLEYTYYSFEEIQGIHNNITIIINHLSETINRFNYTIEDDSVRINKGVNINQLVYEKKYTIEILNQKKELFSKILKDYYSFQKKFLERIKLKFKLLFYHIEKDVEFEFVSYSESDSKISYTKKSAEQSIIYELLENKKTHNILYTFFLRIFNFFCIYT